MYMEIDKRPSCQRKLTVMKLFVFQNAVLTPLAVVKVT